MQLPQKKKGYTHQRLVFRRILLSATLLLPAGSLSAEESGKPSGDVAGVGGTKPQAALSLPSFPAAPAAAQDSSKISGTPAVDGKTATAPVKATAPATVSPSLPNLPPASLTPPPVSGTRPSGGVSNPLPLKAADASSTSGMSGNANSINSNKNPFAPITSTTADAKSTAAKAPEISVVFPGSNPSAMAIQGNAQPSRVPESKRTISSSVPAPSLSSPGSQAPTPVKNSTRSEAAVQQTAVKGEESDDGVMIRFGVKPRAEAEGVVRGIPGGKKEPIPATTPAPANNSSSFRLSDKTNIAIAPKPEPKPAAVAPQVIASKVAATPAASNLPKLPANSAELTASKPTQEDSAKTSATSPKLPTSNSPVASTIPNKNLSIGTVVATPTAGAVSQQKSDAREAVIFRPKAMIVEAAPAAPSALEIKPSDKAVEAAGSKRTPVLANKTTAATSSDGSVTLAVEPTLDLAASVKDVGVSGSNSAAESNSTALSDLVGSSSKTQSTATGPKSNLPTATTIVSSQPPKAIATAANTSVPNASGKQLPAEDVMIALAEPISTDASNVLNSKPGAALAKSEPLPPADRTIKVGTAAFSTIRLGDQQVEKCEVADPNICRAVVTTDGEVAFLPGKVGVTRATLWLKQKSGESKVETAEITVGEALAAGSTTSSGDLDKLNSTLKDLYPGCELSAFAGDRCIEIRGEVDSEQQAKAVLQLVRKLCLVPVKDKVSVR
jgi:hypothetical protein